MSMDDYGFVLEFGELDGDLVEEKIDQIIRHWVECDPYGFWDRFKTDLSAKEFCSAIDENTLEEGSASAMEMADYLVDHQHLRNEAKCWIENHFPMYF